MRLDQIHLKEALKNVKGLVKKHNFEFPTSKQTTASPFLNTSYRAELDETSLCNDGELTLFQNLIGILRWLCELGRVDVLYETSILSQYLAQPRIGHIKQAINVKIRKIIE